MDASSLCGTQLRTVTNLPLENEAIGSGQWYVPL
jgi:hypothetical protein